MRLPRIELVECRFDEATAGMTETDVVAWKLRKQLDIVAEQRNVLEDALFVLWSDPASAPACDEAARLLAVGPSDPAYDLV